MNPRLIACIALGLLLALAPAAAQPRIGIAGTPDAGGEVERYLRALQLSGAYAPRDWTILPRISRPDDDPGSGHPWATRFGRTPDRVARSWRVLRGEARGILNSSFPYADNDGDVWAGRGLTVALRGGVSGTRGPLRWQLAPMAFAAQNAAFQMVDNRQAGGRRFGDARFPALIDAPQRFGDATYGAVTLGSSFAQMSTTHLAAGLSTMAQHWGPARGSPLVLSENAGGFAHAFIGTAAPAGVGLGQLSARLIVGHLSQTAFSPVQSGERARVASGLALVLQPKGAPGLELGLLRFATSAWPKGGPGWHEVWRLFSGVVSRQDLATVNDPKENQLMSAFVRWVLPGGRTELYGEYARDDYSGNSRWYLYKPDDYGFYLFGFQHATRADGGALRVVRAEVVNGEASHHERGQRGGTAPYPPYIHFGLLQGHTSNGLVLGSPDAFGGAGSTVAVDAYTPSGRWTFGVERHLRLDWIPATTNALPGKSPATPGARPDVTYAVRIERLRFGAARDYALSAIPAVNLNRNAVAGADRMSLRVALTVSGGR